MGCGKITYAGIALYGAPNNKFGMWNTEQIVWNDKTWNSISQTGKRRSIMNMKIRVIFIFNFTEMATYKNVLVEAQYWLSNL